MKSPCERFPVHRASLAFILTLSREAELCFTFALSLR